MSNEIIIKTPGICGGKPRIRNSRITVENIMKLYNEGESIEDMHKSFPHVSKREINNAISYGKALDFLETNDFTDACFLEEMLKYCKIRYFR
jgi:uncharacterized protein (DUF433 family)